MTRPYLVLFLIIMLGHSPALLAQGNGNPQSDREIETLRKAGVKRLIIHRQEVKKNGDRSSDPVLEGTWIYNQKGLLIKNYLLGSDTGHFSHHSRYVYNDRDQIESSETMVLNRYKFGSSSNPPLEVHAQLSDPDYADADTLFERVKYAYDGDNNCTGFTRYGNGGKIRFRRKQVWDDNQHIVQESDYRFSESKEPIHQQHVWDKNRLVLTLSYDTDPNQPKAKTHYHYDAKGQLIRETTYRLGYPNPGDSTLSSERVFTYHLNGQQASVTHRTLNMFRSKNHPMREDVRTFDEFGNLISYSWPTGTSKLRMLQKRYRYTYHPNGLIQSKTWLRKSGRPIMVERYNYDYFEEQ